MVAKKHGINMYITNIIYIIGVAMAIIHDVDGFYYKVTNEPGWAGADPQGYYQNQYRWDNPYLLNNAECIFNQLNGYGWDRDSICAVIGNMARECRLNPAQTQDGYQIGGTTGGFGLAMWTPQTKYTIWCRQENHTVNSGAWQLYFINTKPTREEQRQFNEHDGVYNITWDEFIHNTREYSVEELTAVWLKCYERAGVSALQQRLYYSTNYAQYFYNYEPQPSPPPTPEPYKPVSHKMPLWMMVGKHRNMFVIK